MNRFSRGAIALMALTAAGMASAQNATATRDRNTSSFEQAPYDERGFSLQIDNDLFSGASRDQDYSWGGAVTYASPHPGRLMRPLHSVRRHMDDWLAPRDSDSRDFTPEQQATQIGILAMTPATLRSAEPILGDRPFANLLFVTSAQIRVLEGGDRARFSSFTFGMMGLHAAAEAHRFVHRAIGNELPEGWDHQISAGGEPTARYVQAQQWLLTDAGSRNAGEPEFKLTLQGSAGFITEGSIALSTRWGRIQSPWWSFDPELGDYTSAPVAPVARFNSRSPAEVFAFAGVRLKARAYNALLQGQFRHSDVRVQGDDLAHAQAEAWAGLATAWSEYRITYAVHFASRELTSELGDRSIIWAGINFEKSLD
jgi:hypothetical protein